MPPIVVQMVKAVAAALLGVLTSSLVNSLTEGEAKNKDNTNN